MVVAAASAVLLVIAAIGGGWLALHRADPLLAVPGLGWTVLFLLGLLPQQRLGATILAAAACAVVVIAVSATLAGGLAGGAVARQGLVLAAVAMATAGAAYAARAALYRAVPGRSVPRWLLWPLIIAVGVAYTAAAQPALRAAYAAQPRSGGPSVVLITSLPLASAPASVSEALRSDTRVSPALAWLQHRHDVRRGDAASVERLRDGDVLLLAHPPALSPQQMVALDAWLRRGGSALILADAISSAPPPYPLGDARNPPITSLLTPLLDHWGLRLDAPAGMAETAVTLFDRGQRLALFSAGTMVAGRGEADCEVRASGHVARCRVGRGRAVVVADADWLNAAMWQSRCCTLSLLHWRSGNMAWLSQQLDALGEGGRRDSPAALAWAEPVWMPIHTKSDQ